MTAEEKKKQEQKEQMKMIVNFLVSEFVMQTEEAMLKAKPKHKFGNIEMLTYLVDEKQDVHQRLTWTNFKDSNQLTEEEKKKLQETFQINIADEFAGKNAKQKKCKTISCTIDVKKIEIRVKYVYVDGDILKFTI